jgi:superfamily II DNA/RNA helicase
MYYRSTVARATRRSFKAYAVACRWLVGTQGRVMDHIKQGTLKLATLKHIVLEVISCLSA